MTDVSAEIVEDCYCMTCFHARTPNPLDRQRFIVCEHCGNKRCPHATWHIYGCTGSNAPGQPGSIFGGLHISSTSAVTALPLPAALGIESWPLIAFRCKACGKQARQNPANANEYGCERCGASFSAATYFEPLPAGEQQGAERPSMARLRAIAGDKVADACQRGIDKAMEEIRAEEKASEKDRRIYYQDIVYSVCELLDTVYTPSTCCGICTAPTTQVQDRVRSLIQYRDQQSEKYQAELAALRTQLAAAEQRVKEAEEIGERMAKYLKWSVKTTDGILQSMSKIAEVTMEHEYFCNRHEAKQSLTDWAAYRAKYEVQNGPAT